MAMRSEGLEVGSCCEEDDVLKRSTVSETRSRIQPRPDSVDVVVLVESRSDI